MAEAAHAHEMHLKVLTMDRPLFDGPVRAVSFQGLDGSYGILPRHAALVTAVPRSGSHLRITRTDGSTQDLVVAAGFVEVRDNAVTFVVLSGEKAEEIDVERAHAAEQKARELLDQVRSEDRPSEELLRAQAAVQRAMLRQILGKRTANV
ncbi:MAG: ATP synthase F1 subunit epsilon [Planctomycetes bacterium]|nr:ATP synthase F1 subunit epsilon [Planctomycetota bacterium]